MAKCKETLAITNHRVIAEDINEHETVYGGRILEILDGTASTSAARLARTQTVTAAIDDVNFIAPFALHDSFCVESYVTGVGTHSIEVFAKVVGEHLLTGERFLGMTAFFTFVILDKSVEPEPIIPESHEEKMLCKGYEQRRKRKKAALNDRLSFNHQLSIDLPY